MLDSANTAREILTGVLSKLGLELNFVEPGSDAGLLPVNSLVAEIEEYIAGQTPPGQIGVAVSCARRWLDRLFDNAAVFDAPTIDLLCDWRAWMESALDCWSSNRACPELPAAWDAAESDTRACPTPAKPLTGPGIAALQEAGNPDDAAEPVLVLCLESDEELLREFIGESQEHLQNIENGVLILEENPTDADTLNSIFRAFHTFKGGSGFLNLTPIKTLAHELESLLDAARQGKLAINSAIIDLILQGGDTLKLFVAEIGAQLDGANVGAGIVVPTLQLIEQVQAVLANPGQSMPNGASSDAPPTDYEGVGVRPPVVVGSEGGVAEVGIAPAAPAGRPALSSSADSIKVDTAKLDSLIDLVGELVLSESMVVQDPVLESLPSRHLARNLAQLRRITSELQRTAMSLRMVPVRATFQKMTRLVRDLAATQHKQVQLQFSGEDTELDRNIVEALGDPLVHMIRNSADHGIEMPEVRLANGKPAQGTIQLRAFHQGGNIVIQIEDDGAGLNKGRILAKAIEKGIVAPGEAMADKDIFGLIFAAGFSTAEKITDISGRGVGMDVVRRNIEKLRGKIEIESVTGKGTTFSIFLPLTLAIIDGMIVSVGGERFIIPTLSVRESFRPRAEMISTIHGRAEMINVRGRLCPLLRLYEYFDCVPKIANPTEAIVIVVESGSQTRCLMVDELIGKQEVVIKGLGETFKNNRALAGGAVLGDGRVGLILDVDSLIRLDPPAASLAA